MSKIALGAVVAAVFAAACARAPDQPASAQAQQQPPTSSLPTQTQLDRLVAEGPDTTLRKLSVTDYWLHYKLMQATGIERELGGEAQAIAALQSLGNAYERKLRGAEADLPKMIPASFTGEGMSSGFTGMGMGSFLGLMTGSMLSGAVSSMSDEHLADLVKAGPIKFDGKDGNATLEFGKDGSLSQSMDFEVNENGLNGKVKVKTRMDACPDPQGRVAVDMDVDSQMSVSGKPGVGGYVRSHFRYERYLDDDAHLIDTGEGGASNLRISMGGFENFQSQSVDITTGHARGGKPIFEDHDEQGFSIFQPGDVERTKALLQGAETLQTLVAEFMLRGLGAESPWEGGHCVTLKVTSSPAKRKGIKPNTAFDLEAIPRVKSDGGRAGGTVTATLNGGASLQPASGKVPADARYQYAGPAKKKEKATIDFEARSKRGVGKATLEFDTQQSGYHLVGIGPSAGEGDVCDLSQPFTVKGPVIVDHTPTSDRGGTTSYSGQGITGKGTYTIEGTGDHLTMTYTSTACFMGHCRAAKSKATLTRIESCE